MKIKTAPLVILFTLVLLQQNSLQAEHQARSWRLKAGSPDIATSSSQVTTKEYCLFLNAIATTDSSALYDEKMGTQATDYRLQATGPNTVANCILRLGSPGYYSHTITPESTEKAVLYIDRISASHYCDWLEKAGSTYTFTYGEAAYDELLRSNLTTLQIVASSSIGFAKKNSTDNGSWKTVAEDHLLVIAAVSAVVVASHLGYDSPHDGITDPVIPLHNARPAQQSTSQNEALQPAVEQASAETIRLQRVEPAVHLQERGNRTPTVLSKQEQKNLRLAFFKTRTTSPSFPCSSHTVPPPQNFDNNEQTNSDDDELIIGRLSPDNQSNPNDDDQSETIILPNRFSAVNSSQTGTKNK